MLASFNSFLPKDLPKDYCNRIIEAYIQLLDKIDSITTKLNLVAFTAWFPGFIDIAKSRLGQYGVLDDDIKLEKSLKKLRKMLCCD